MGLATESGGDNGGGKAGLYSRSFAIYNGGFFFENHREGSSHLNILLKGCKGSELQNYRGTTEHAER